MPVVSNRRGPLADLLALSAEPVQPQGPVRRSKPRRQRPNPFATPPPPPEEAVDEPWGMRDYAAMGVRGLGGLLGVGSLPGAAAGAGSELIASAIEGDNLLDADTLKEIAAAGALGAAGGGIAKVVSAGAGPLQALLRGGALSAGGEAASELIRDEELDPTSIATAGALGGGAAAGTSALLRKLGVNLPPSGRQTPEPARREFEIEMTPGPGVQTPQGQPNIPSSLGGGPLIRTLRGEGGPVARPIPITEDPRPGAYPDAGGLSPRAQRAVAASTKAQNEAVARARIAGAMDEGLVPQDTISESFRAEIPGGTRSMRRRYVEPAEDEAGDLGDLIGVPPPSGRAPVAPPTPPVAAPAARAAGGLGELLGVAERRSAERMPELDEFFQAERAGVNPLGIAPTREAAAADDIAAQLTDEPLPAFEERRAQVRLPEDDVYTQALQAGASPEDAEAIRAQAGFMRRSAEQRALTQPSPLDELLAVPPQGTVQGAESTVPLAALSRTPGDVANEHYRALKSIFGAGESGLPSEVAPQVQRVAQNKVAGRAAKRIGDAEGGQAPAGAIPVKPEGPGPASTPAPAPAAPERFGAKASESLKRFFMEQEGRGGRTPLGPTGLGSRAGGQGGFANPELAASMGLGLIGAAGGAAWDPLGNPLMSGLLGGAAGAALPQMASRIANMAPTVLQSGQVDPETGQLLQQIGTPQGLGKTMMDMVRTLPAVQRGMLLSNPNIFNNALVAPYGSAVSFGLERALAGDPRGWEVLRQMQPQTFTQNFINSWDEASRLIGDAERSGGQMLGEAANKVEYVAALPGTFMAGGDLAARKAIMSAGFTEAEARMATLTSEPETKFGKSIVNMQRTGGPLAQMALPFARTIVNLGEQGVRRIPGVGYIAQAAREQADPMGVQHIQQLLGGGALLGGYAAGDQLEGVAEALPGDEAGNMRLLRSFLSNAAGPNATLATMGLAAGAAAADRKDPLQQLGAAVKTGVQETPLPTTAPAEDIIDFATAEPGNRRIPRSMVPGIVRDELNELLFGTGSEAGGRRKRRTRKREER